MANAKYIQVKVYCEGQGRFLMNPMTTPILEGIRLKKPIQRKSDLTLEDEAKVKILRGPAEDGEEQGPIGITTQYLYSCLVEAGRQVEHRTSRERLSTKESSFLPSFLDIEEEFLPFVCESVEDYDAEEDWVPSMMPGKANKDGSTVAIVRPWFKHWGFYCTLVVDTSQIDMSKIIRLFEIAGRQVGLGDYRPARRGRQGKFRLKRWHESFVDVEADDAIDMVRVTSDASPAEPKARKTRASKPKVTEETVEETVNGAKEAEAVPA